MRVKAFWSIGAKGPPSTAAGMGGFGILLCITGRRTRVWTGLETPFRVQGSEESFPCADISCDDFSYGLPAVTQERKDTSFLSSSLILGSIWIC